MDKRAWAILLAWASVAQADDAPTRVVVPISELPPLPPMPARPLPPVSERAADTSSELALGLDATATVTVITREQIERLGYRTVADALRSVAGLFVTDDRLGTQVGIRGSAFLGDQNRRVLIVIDGMPINDAWAGQGTIGFDAPIAIDAIERIEVVRSPAASMYGADALLAAIHIFTRAAEGRPRVWLETAGSTAPTAGGTVGFSVGSLRRNVRAHASGWWRGAESLAVDGVDAGRSADGQTAAVGALVGQWDGAWWQARAVQQRRESPFAPYDGDPTAPVPYVGRHAQFTTEVGYTRALGSLAKGTVRAWWQRHRFASTVDRAAEARDFVTVGDSSSVGLGVYAQTAPWAKRLELRVGAELGRVDTRSDVYSADNPSIGGSQPIDFSTISLVGEIRSQLARGVTLVGGVQANSHSTFGLRASPRLAVHWQRSDVGLKALYADGYRAPQIAESSFADGAFFVANPAIRMEANRTVELVAWGRWRDGLVRVSAFRWSLRRPIEQVALASDTGSVQFQNRGQRNTEGVELEASWRDARGWLVMVGGSVARVRADGVWPINAPAVVAAATVSTPRWYGMHGSLELSLISERRTRDPAVPVPARAQLGATIWAPRIGPVGVRVMLRSIMGAQAVVAPEAYARESLVPTVPGDGREVYASISWDY